MSFLMLSTNSSIDSVSSPLATILSAAMMLDWLGDKHGDSACTAAASALETAVAQVLLDGDVRTADIGGTSLTTDVANAVAEALTTTAKVS